jgi:hypothetical protein
MAKLPTAQDLGPVPFDGSRRPIAQAHVPDMRGAGVGVGVQGLGKGIVHLADSFQRVQHEQDETEYRNAKSDLIKNTLDLDTKYADDPDYTSVRDRYMADFDGYVAGNIASIQSPRLRDRLLREAGEMAARKDNSYSPLALKQGADDARAKWLATGQDYLTKASTFNDDQAASAIERFNLIGDNLAGMRGGPSRVQIQIQKDKFKKQFDDVRFAGELDTAKQNADFDRIEARERTRPTVPETVGGPFDRRQFYSELEQKPWLRERLQTIVQGEGGHSADPETKQIYLESIFNRAAARGQTLEQVTKEYTGPGSDGYYPRTTLVNGRIRNKAQYDDFQPVYDAVLGGSDRSTEVLGFPATGNASAGVAQRGVSSGRYARSGNLGGGQTGAPGVETFVQGHGSDDVELLESSRTTLGESGGGYGYTESTRAGRLKQIETARRRFLSDQMASDAAARRQETLEASNEAFRMIGLLSDPETAHQVTHKSIYSNPIFSRTSEAGLAAAQKVDAVLAARKREMEDKQEKSLGEGYVNLLNRVSSSGPDRITDDYQLLQYLQPVDGGKPQLTVNGFEKLSRQIANKTGDGKDIQATTEYKNLINYAKDRILGPDDFYKVKDPERQKKFGMFQMDLDRALTDAQKEGGRALQMKYLDARDTEYFGNILGEKDGVLKSGQQSPYVMAGKDRFKARIPDQKASTSPSDYKDPNSVITAFQGGKLSREDAGRILIANGWADPDPPPINAQVPISR